MTSLTVQRRDLDVRGTSSASVRGGGNPSPEWVWKKWQKEKGRPTYGREEDGWDVYWNSCCLHGPVPPFYGSTYCSQCAVDGPSCHRSLCGGDQGGTCGFVHSHVWKTEAVMV